MSILSKEKGLYDSEVEIVSQSEDYTVYRMVSGDGGGTMTSYEVFPGVELIYNDFHMSSCLYNKHPCKDIMEINHCRQGRFECDLGDGSCIYLEEGDLSVHMLSNLTKNSCFPLEHYYGVSVVIDLPEASQAISGYLTDISIDLLMLREKLCINDRCFIMRATDSVEHIFSELYRVPDEIKRGYFKLKVLELLLFLSVTEVSGNVLQRKYFHKSQVDIMKEIKDYMTGNLEQHPTLNDLSIRFGIPLTAMKLCFKGIYGTSIYAFMRTYRIQAAAELLRQSTDSVSVIAGKVGYSNSSKFASAFREILGVPPLTYRKLNQ